ncbi:hypothetical protein SAMN05216330_112145 [Bradyrhizobium sp. Ghvi]|uniref:hypothetical protein n=1 Tax=Bradyrhizobium sp. Ghvi TaxID=1855319 RepID=UPI0008DFD580|nr:hypothetical protein [Bradyrhizobium sp. Ghvi]SFP94902.1 hypothetical protein SAMN05216330_112145 [Bradyrhizobium sp. Ghvi]
MPGHKLPRSTRLKLKAGAVVQVRRGWRREELPAQAGPCKRLDPVTGETIGILIRVPSARLRLSARPSWAFQRRARP